MHAVTHRAKITMLAWAGLLALTVALALGVVLVGMLPMWQLSESGLTRGRVECGAPILFPSSYSMRMPLSLSDDRNRARSIAGSAWQKPSKSIKPIWL